MKNKGIIDKGNSPKERKERKERISEGGKENVFERER